jgi:hypothetical protein
MQGSKNVYFIMLAPYMNDAFNEYYNLLNGTLSVVVHEWALDLNNGLENLGFKIANCSIMMHFCCLETSFYVLVT